MIDKFVLYATADLITSPQYYKGFKKVQYKNKLLDRWIHGLPKYYTQYEYKVGDYENR